jgi:uncharacterized damage-inducible protein DinB
MRELERLFSYDAWANREALSALRVAGNPPAVAVRRFAHILGAQQTWLQRLAGGAKPEVWPELTLDACASQLEQLRGRWRDLLATGGDAGRRISYTNTKGDRFESTVGEILLHVVLHGAYHRGQIASDLRGAGHEPPLTDFIHATRERFV